MRRLGALVGEMLREREGDAFFELVESTRKAAVSARRIDEADVWDRIVRVGPETRASLVRAFSAYFEAVNIGEQIHRLRRGREYERSGPQPDGPPDVFERLKRDGFDAPRVEAALASLVIEPVFTAHPTEAVRRTLLTKQQRIARALVDRIEPRALTPVEETRAWARVREEITTAWQTGEHLSRQPTLSEEAEHVLFYLRAVIYRIVPLFYEALIEGFEQTFGRRPSGRPSLRFGTWVGGDMDGNPNVGADTIRETLERQRTTILRLYRDEADGLIEHLSQTEGQAGFSNELRALLSERAAEFPKAAGSVPVRHRSMPYRVLLRCVVEKLKATGRNGRLGYVGPEELLEDLRIVADCLQRNRGTYAGLHRVQRLIGRVECFGFHFATLDVRQDSEVHRTVCGRLLGDSRFAERSPRERSAILHAAWQHPAPASSDDEETRKTLEVFRTVRDVCRRFGSRSVGPYIVSMAHGVDDVLAVLFLARAAGVGDEGSVGLDIAPLFETVDDLDNAGSTLETMVGDELYRKHLRSRADVQYVMLGYSDSGKDSGIAAARWALFRAQEELARASAQAGMKLVLFHGRGGTVSRGGTKVTEAIPAQPPGSVRGRLRVTEQGEIIHARYGLRGIARRTLEVTAGAVLDFSLREDSLPPPEPAWRAIMDSIAAGSRKAYRGFVHDNADLFDYFQLATPLDVITLMNIGSRPASRRRRRGIDDLRAIPWVFAWTQSRHMLPGWYGVGQGLRQAIDDHGLEPVRDAVRVWPPLRTLLGDVEMVMAKADMRIAARYAELAGEAGCRLFGKIRAAFDRSHGLICEVCEIDDLLEREPWLARAIELRNPYIDPMSLMQIEMLREWRAGNRQDRALEQALFTSVKGIARGLMNTG